MKTISAFIISLAMSSSLTADMVSLSWIDASDNEQGFEMRGRLPNSSWEVIGVTVSGIETMFVDSDAHEAWQVFSWNYKWGSSAEKQFSVNGTNILEKGSVPTPEDPESLRITPTDPEPISHNHKFKKYHEYAKRNWRR